METNQSTAISLIPLTDDLKDEYLSLTVFDTQSRFVESPSESLQDQQNHAWQVNWNIDCIYARQQMIGYAMHGLGIGNVAWLDRFMIDQHFQGKGYGNAALTMLLDKMKAIYPNRKIIALSVDDQNHQAIKMYRKFGFEMTDKMDGRYPVMILKENQCK